MVINNEELFTISLQCGAEVSVLIYNCNVVTMIAEFYSKAVALFRVLINGRRANLFMITSVNQRDDDE